ncbi:MAG: hypothetical protein JSV10_02575 [Candidatus Zixiibacteriota bacterium]|nr:MAG: hypothetical protein JSV10_02575 [candidate division Zixibacteria bacterium]
MTAREKQMDAMEMLANHEDAIGGLYKAYAKLFPNHESFWSGLAREETEHATWIRNLATKTEAGSARLDQKRFKIEAIQTSLDYIKNLAAEAPGQKIELIDGLSTALDIEKALIERKYFEILQGDSEEVKRTLEALTRSTKAHVERVQKAWAENK